MCCIIHKCYIHRLRVFFWLPVVGEVLFAAWTYYVYVFAMCLATSEILLEKSLLLFFYHLVFLLALWCYLRSVFTKSYQPLPEFTLDAASWKKLNDEYLWIQRREEMENIRKRLGIKTAQTSIGRGLIIYCNHCQVIKPDRCHHCSRCGVCVLKMDHHCPWINNCVGFSNYKYFILFISYAALTCVFVSLTSLRFVVTYFIDIYRGAPAELNRIQIVVMFVLVSIYGLVLTPLLKLQWRLLLSNITTLENTRPVGVPGKSPDHRLFNLGKLENFCQVFGRNRSLWFFPVFTSLGDGVHFPIRDEIYFGHEVF